MSVYFVHLSNLSHNFFFLTDPGAHRDGCCLSTSGTFPPVKIQCEFITQGSSAPLWPTGDRCGGMHQSTRDHLLCQADQYPPTFWPFYNTSWLVPAKCASSCQGSWKKQLWRWCSVLNRGWSLPLQAAVPIFYAVGRLLSFLQPENGKWLVWPLLLDWPTLRGTWQGHSQLMRGSSPRGWHCLTSHHLEGCSAAWQRNYCDSKIIRN